MTPAWWKSASTAASEPASAAVCELAARWPVAVVPLLSARIGLVRATRRASRPKRRGLPNDSTYMSTTSVASSSSHHSSRSLVETSALLPIDTNADRPSPRDSAASSSASPSAPLWEEKPMLPAGRRAGGEGRVQARPGDGDAEAVGPDQPRSVGADEREQLLLPLHAFAADLGEAGGDHDEGANALAQRLLRRPENRGARQGDHGEIDRIGDLLDRAVGADAGDRLAVAVDRVGGAGEVAGEDVAEQLAADRAAPLGGADDGDAPGLEERLERGDDRLVVARVDVLAVALRRRDRELHLHLAALELAGQLEACRLEDAEHGPVVRQHVGDEALDPDLGRARRELLEQPGADAAALMLVGDGEGRLGELGVAQADVVRDGDDPLAVLVDERAQERPALLPVRLDERLDEPRAELREAVEAQVEAPLRQPAEEGQQGVGVVAAGRAKPQRAAVAEDDVGVFCRDHRGQPRSRRRRCRAEPEQPEHGDRDREHVGRQAPLADRVDDGQLDVEQVGAEGEGRERERGLAQTRPIAAGERRDEQAEEPDQAERSDRHVPAPRRRRSSARSRSRRSSRRARRRSGEHRAGRR